MDAELKAKWVQALRSGKYDQCKHTMKDTTGFCCLGVLMDIQGVDWGSVDDLHTAKVPDAYNPGLSFNQMMELGKMNDGNFSGTPQPFSEIADYIEANL